MRNPSYSTLAIVLLYRFWELMVWLDPVQHTSSQTFPLLHRKWFDLSSMFSQIDSQFWTSLLYHKTPMACLVI
ncbi:Uncharacterized protein TCM_019531 [Theobroma cacao]|uniref:Uncharacterized protein n=1 Tax=Theobroma cacao TaxID=3641 RepID=A0A061EHE4_THECC|nr:Uncharacterized protein TCM_019531 [Theobroma cacao]